MSQRTSARRGGIVGSLSILLLVALCPLDGASAQSVVCRRERIQGLDREYDRAKSVLPQPTSSLDSCAIYVTKAGGDLYVHSNFKVASARFVTKIATNETKNLLDLFANIVDVDASSLRSEIDRAIAAHKTKVKYVIDQSLVKSDGTIDLEFEGASNLHLLSPGEANPRRMVRLEPVRGPPRFAVQASTNLYVHATPVTAPLAALRTLVRHPFSSDRLSLLKLLEENTATDRAISESGLNKSLLKLDGYSLEAIERAVSGASDKVVVALGHVEENAFVVTDARGREIARVPIQSLEQLAQRHRFTLMAFGCRAAAEGSGGAIAEFNTVYAVRQIANATKESRNFAEFFENVASQDLQLVLPPVEGIIEPFEIAVAASHPMNEAAQVGSIRVVVMPTVTSAGQSGSSEDDADDRRKKGRVLPADTQAPASAPTDGSFDEHDDEVSVGQSLQTVALISVAVIACGAIGVWWYRRTR